MKFAEGTRAGVVALVDGDVRKAFDQLHDRYGVTVVARIEPSETGRVTGFRQIRDLVDRACG